MKSTGEVIGIARTFPACAKTRPGSWNKPEQNRLHRCTTAISAIILLLWLWRTLGYGIYTTGGRKDAAAGIDCTAVNRISDGHPNVVDLMRDKTVSFIPHGAGAQRQH